METTERSTIKNTKEKKIYEMQDEKGDRSELVLKTILLDCTNCTNESLFDIADLKAFYQDRIKIKGQTNQLGKNVRLEISGNYLKIHYTRFICKRYMKYLGKKFLRAKKLNSWVRLVANTKDGYKFSFFNIEKGAEE